MHLVAMASHKLFRPIIRTIYVIQDVYVNSQIEYHMFENAVYAHCMMDSR